MAGSRMLGRQRGGGASSEEAGPTVSRQGRQQGDGAGREEAEPTARRRSQQRVGGAGSGEVRLAAESQGCKSNYKEMRLTAERRGQQ